MNEPAPRDLSRLRIDRSSPDAAHRRGSSPLLWLVLLALIGYLAWERLAPLSDDAPIVDLASVVRTGGGPPPTGIAANGYVVARTRAAISTDIQGRLVQLEVEEGDRVAAGELIARLDTRQLEASRAQASAEVERRRASLRLAQLDVDRQKKLRTTGDATQEELDTAMAELDGAQADLDAAIARVAEIEVMIDKSSVYAPFSGVVILKNAEVGEVVSALGAGGGGSSRGAVATLVDFDTLEIQVELAQTSLGAAQVGAPVSVYLDAYPRDRYPGRVRQIWPTADRQKATVELRVELLQRDDRVLPDMGCRVVFETEHSTSDSVPQLFVPKASLVPGSDPPRVFLFEDGRAVSKSIEVTGEESEGRVAVGSGLTGGETLIVSPPETLRDGDRVRRRDRD
ncbi:MAG: efflux RND transporter periplasmic adaptor subunit [Planctomycetes bacterium]|nr:efflux RND transporter periplasmic adaptor subunit [Planctomycetota bacterium]